MQSPAGTNAPEADLAEVEMHKATIDAANNASDPRAAQLSIEAKTIQGQLYKLKPRTYAQLALLVAAVATLNRASIETWRTTETRARDLEETTASSRLAS